MVGTGAIGARATGGVLDGKAAGCGIWGLALDGPQKKGGSGAVTDEVAAGGGKEWKVLK